MTKTEEPTIALPELEEPFCCPKIGEVNVGQDLPVVTTWEIISDQKWGLTQDQL
jgi:hypothetical protein